MRQRIRVQPDISPVELKDDPEFPVCISA
jgi:hypothetical protein